MATSNESDPIKAELAEMICEVLKSRGLTQSAAAELLQVAQPDVSNLVRGKLGRFSAGRLQRFLNALDLDIRIRIGPCPKWKDCAGVTVERVERFEDESGAAPAFE